MIRLSSDEACVGLDPAQGGSIMDYTLVDGRQVFRTPAPDDPFAVACLPMVPWCNRISGGIATSEGFAPIAPNITGQGCPLHGSGFQAEWIVAEQDATQVTLTLRLSHPSPFDFEATQTLRLSGADLTVTLSATHYGDMPLPYGLGLHPWFPRTKGTSIQAKAASYQSVDDAMLPTADVPISERPDWNFSDQAPLPNTLIDTCFGGWDGHARISWPDRGMALDIETAPVTAWYQVYSPSPDCGFFCFEPVTHPINAHNTDGTPGLAVLKRGETTSLTVTFRPREIAG